MPLAYQLTKCFHLQMSRARKHILHDNSLTHITSRCHNQEFYLESDFIKRYVYETLVKCRKVHGISIIEYVFMSNHIHMLVCVESLPRISSFMRHANSLIARKINEVYNKRSQAIEDRYKSPVIEDESYCLNTMLYVWFNPVRARMIQHSKVQDYPWSSLYRRFRGLKDPLVDAYDAVERVVGYRPGGTNSVQRFVADLIAGRQGELNYLSVEVYESLHSVGSDEFRISRRQLFDSS